MRISDWSSDVCASDLAEREPTPLAAGGFGGEVREAMAARADHLAQEGFVRRQGQRVVLQRDLLSTLSRRGLDAAAARLSADTGLPDLTSAAGEHVTGVSRQRLPPTSGRLAMSDYGPGFPPLHL